MCRVWRSSHYSIVGCAVRTLKPSSLDTFQKPPCVNFINYIHKPFFYTPCIFMVRLCSLRRPLFDLILFRILFQSFSPFFFWFLVAPDFAIKFCDDFSFALFVPTVFSTVCLAGKRQRDGGEERVIVWARQLLSLVAIVEC